MAFKGNSSFSEFFADMPSGGELDFHYHAEHYSGVTVEQSTEDQELFMPSPYKRRLTFAIDVMNTGSTSFVMHGVVVDSLASQRFSWGGADYHATNSANSSSNIEGEIVAKSNFVITNPTASSIKVDAGKSLLNDLELGSSDGTHTYMIESTRHYLDVTAGGDVVATQAGANVDYDAATDMWSKNVAGNSWNSYFYSSDTVIDADTQDAAITAPVELDHDSDGFTGAQGTIREMFGISSNPTKNASYNSIDYAIYQVNATTVYAFQGGSNKGSFSRPMIVGDRLGIRIDSGVVSFIHIRGTTETVVFVSDVLASGKYYAKGAFNRGVGSSGVSVMGDVQLHTTTVAKPMLTHIQGDAGSLVTTEDRANLLELGLSANSQSVYSNIIADVMVGSAFPSGTKHQFTHSYFKRSTQSSAST